MLPGAIPVCLCGYCRRRPDLGASRHYPRLCVAPERNQQLACHGYNGDPACAPGQRADPLAEPLCQLAAGLVAKPEPCELDHGRPCARVSSPAYAPITVHTAALVGHRRDADVARNLPAVVECPIEYLSCEHGRDVFADTPDATESGDLAAAL